MSIEHVVVRSAVVGNPTAGYDIESWEISRHPTMHQAKRSGLRELGDDDFNIAVLVDGKLARWTWMGEECEGATPEDMPAYADRMGWQLSSEVAAPR